MQTENKLLNEMRIQLKWTDGDDDSFKKHKSFYAIMKMNKTNRDKYLDGVKSGYLLDMYKNKLNKAWSYYYVLNELNSDNKARYQYQLEKLESIIEYIA